MSNNIVDVKNLTVQFGSDIVVDNISVSVGRGEILGILGPNGAGKSCTVRAMLDLLPHSGSVSFFGTSTKNRKHVLPLIGYIPQKIDFEPLFPATVYDIVSMGITKQKNRKRGLELLEKNGMLQNSEKRYMKEANGCKTCLPCEDPRTKHEMVKDALNTVGMSSMINRRITELSGGQRQRTFIAQSLVKDPLLLIMDEPVSNMDVESQMLVYSAIRQAVKKHNVTVIISLHDLDVLLKHTNTVLFINKSLLYHGSTKEFFADKDRVKMYTNASMNAGGHTHM